MSTCFSYFSCSSSSAIDSPDSITTQEILSNSKNFEDSDVASKSPTIQRSPLKIRNNDDERHPISPVKTPSSTHLESYSETGVSSSSKKRLNPFAVANREKIIRFNEDNEKSSNAPVENASSQKKESTFKWTESIGSAVTNGCELSNGRWSMNSVPTDNRSPQIFDDDDDDEPVVEKQVIYFQSLIGLS